MSRIRETVKFVLRVTYELYWTEAQTLSKSVRWLASRTKMSNETSFKISKRVCNK